MNPSDDQTTTENDDRQLFYEQPAYTTLNASDASIILAYYSLQPYHSHRQVTGGLINSNYCIVSEDESHYFCKICDEKTDEITWAQLKALIALQSYKLPLSYPLKRQNNPNSKENDNNINKEARNDDGVSIANYILHISSIRPPIVMYEWKYSRAGKFASLSSSSYTSLGTVLARIHSVDYREFLYLPSFPFGMAKMLPLCYEELPTLSKSLQQHSFVAVMKRELQHICQTLYKKTPYEVYKDRDYVMTNDNCKSDSENQNDLLPLAILHGDLFLENTLFQPDGELDAIVDWECISVGERVIDVTMGIVGCCYDNNDTLSLSRATAFISAYQKILPLTLCERKYFETFLRYSLLSIACIRWYRFNVLFPSNGRSNAYLPIVKRMNNIDSEVIQQLLLS